jgi:diacylglycerol O-acyltransferase / wax synthase
MSAVDTAWLRMDRPDNLMMICGVMILRDRIRFARLLAIVERQFLRFPRFSQRPVEEAGVTWWERDRAFDLARHVVRSTLPGKAGTKRLQALVSRLVSAPLDPAHPLWQFHLVDNYGGGSALIMRIHHCYADGIALTRVLLSMTETSRHPRAAKASPAKRAAHHHDVSLPFLPDSLNLALKAGALIIEKGVEIWRDPARALALANQGTALAAEVAKLALMQEDSPTRFKGTPGVVKRAAWADPIALSEVKAVGKALHASVNDVLLSCVAGALRAYLTKKGDPVDGVAIRALVPVNLRPLDQALELGNQFGLVFLDLPIGVENPVERLYAVRANMNALKASWQPVLSLGLLAAMGSGPKLLQDQLLLALARNATAVMTNVPGPQLPLYLAGAKIESQMVWVPQSGSIGMGVSILSYNGQVQFGLLTDRGLCPDPERISGRFGPEFRKLRGTLRG